MKKALLPLILICSAIALAAPSVKSEDTAPGYPAWNGVVKQNHIYGRELSGAFLRHRIVTVVEFDAANLEEQLAKIPSFLTEGFRFPIAESFGSESSVISSSSPRKKGSIFSVRGKMKNETILERILAFTKSEKGKKLSIYSALSIYKNIGIEKAPETEGKRPYVYVMGIEGEEPIYHSPVSSLNQAELLKAISNSTKNVPQWRPFYGTLSESKLTKELEAALEKAKPLRTIEAKFRKNVKSSDPTVAKESQILADAIEQEKLDAARRIYYSSTSVPWITPSLMKSALSYWPELKKSSDVLSAQARLRVLPSEFQIVSKAFELKQKYSDPDFKPKNAGVAKKVVLEIKKAIKLLEPIKESKNLFTQNGAMKISMDLESLAETIPSLVN